MFRSFLASALLAMVLAGCAHVTPAPSEGAAAHPGSARGSSTPRRIDAEPGGSEGGCSVPVHAPRPAPPCTADTPPKAIEKVPPEYPDTARDQGVQGEVVILALVCEHGRVVDTRVEKSVPMLDRAATEAVKRWTYAAAVDEGAAVPCWTMAPVRFSLH